MSVTQRKSSKKKAAEPIDRPFARDILRKAKELVAQYRLVMQREDDGYGAIVLEMPSIYGFGITLVECEKETRALATTAVAYLLETGQEPPAPASDEKRTEQVNIRLTSLEKARLEEASRQQGFRGLSDYIRSKALN